MHEIGTITDSDAMFCYFKIMQKLKAGFVLDAGMFLKRIGAVSRQMAGEEVDADTVLCGIDFFAEINLPVFENVYNEIITWDNFMNCLRDGFECFACMENRKFDLAVMLGSNERLDDSEKIKITEYFMQKADEVLTDEPVGKLMAGEGMIKGYYPICIESSRYAWIPVGELRI